MIRPLALTLALICLCARFGHAQGSTASMRAGDELRAYKASLKLTPEQRSQIRDIRRKYAPKIDAVHARFHDQLDPLFAESGGATIAPSSPDLQKKIAAVRKKVNAALVPIQAAQRNEELAVYTPEQRKLVVEWERTHPPKR